MEFKSFMEVLKGKQHKIDKNKNGKIDAHDFKLLQKEEQEITEASVKSEKHSWGKMMTVHHGASHSYPLHPEHQEAIRNLKHGEKTSFKDETGAKVNVHRDVQDVHFTSNKTSTKTTVPHSHFSEEVEHIYEVNHRELASVGKMHPQMAKYMTKGHEMDFYAQGSGDKLSGVVKHNNGKEVHVQANKNGKLGGGLVHKFKVSSVHEETAPWETEAEAKARKASSNFKKPSNPNRTGMDTARALAQKAMKQKMKEEFGLDITDEQADSLLEMSHAPVAPVPDRKYIKGTPEHKAYKATKKPINGMPTNVKETFDADGNIINSKVSYKDFAMMLEYEAKDGRYVHKGSYGGNYVDPEGADDADDKKKKPTAEKRGRGRPAGATSGARKITGTSKLYK
jgi:hypothetical protein